METFVTIYDEEEKIWRGAKKSKVCDESTSAGVYALARLRARNPEEIMQISDSENTTMTVGTALKASIRLAQYYRDIGLTADDVVGILSPECTYTMPVALACWFNGTPFQAVSYRLENDAVKHLFDFSRPKIIFCDGLEYEKVKATTASLKPLIFTLCNHLENVAKVEDLLQSTEVDEDLYEAQPLTYGSNQTMAILASSGTSGPPKGSCVPNSIFISDYGVTNSTTIMLSACGLHWSTGLFSFMANVMEGGTRIITMKPFTPEYLLEIVIKYEINFLATNSSLLLQASQLEAYNAENMKSLEMVFIGGAHCSENNLNHIRSVLTKGILIYTYGLTEVGGIAARFSANKANSVGKLFPNVELKIVDPERGQRLGCNEIGEICVKQSYTWRGYYNNPKVTAAMVDKEGFTHTGDLGYMDEENFLFLVGRCKDIMKFMGCQCSPSDIEQIIAELADVLDVCVFGVFDDIKHDVPAAAIIKREGSTLTGEDILAHVNSKTQLPYKRIHYGVFFVKQFPRNQNGKVLRNKVKEMCLEMEKSIDKKARKVLSNPNVCIC